MPGHQSARLGRGASPTAPAARRGRRRDRRPSGRRSSRGSGRRVATGGRAHPPTAVRTWPVADRAAEVDDDQPARVAVPTPGDEVLGAVVARPTGSLAQVPLAAAEGGIGERAQQGLVERLELGIAGLRSGSGRGTSGDGPSGPRAGPRGPAGRRSGVSVATAAARAFAGRTRDAARGSSWFSMKRTSRGLVRVVGQEVEPHLFGALVHESVVEPLVVAVVEALLLQRPLQVPVRLGHEHGTRDATRARRRSRSASSRPAVAAPPRSPQVRVEDVVHHEHRHVAADTVALIGDRRAASRRLHRAVRPRRRSAARRLARRGSTGRDRARDAAPPPR